MNFTHDELCTIETDASRACRAIRQFADKPLRDTLDRAEYILAEVRNAGFYLCDPTTTPEVREIVVGHLLSLFQVEQSK